MIKLTYNNRTLTLVQWANKVGIKYDTLWRRINVYKLSLEESLLPSDRRGKNQVGIKNHQYRKIEDRFWEKVNKKKGCWLWKAGIGLDGYAKFGINGKTIHAHRVSYELTYGCIPIGLCVCHKCDNPKCVNPDHLFIGTVQDNINDRVRKNRTAIQSGEKNGMSRLKEKDIITIRKLFFIDKIKQGEIAKLFFISNQHVSRIINHLKWKHIYD